MPETTYWEPEALIAQLVPGARVRIRVSPECPHGERSVILHKHVAESGVLKMVYPADLGPDRMRSHRFEVDTANETVITAGWFAAVELSPLPAAGPRATEG